MSRITESQPWSTDSIRHGIRQEVVDLFRGLGQLEAIPTFILSPEAQTRFVACHDETLSLSERNDDSPGLAGTSDLSQMLDDNLPTQAARLALVLHLLWEPDSPEYTVSIETLEDAIALAKFHRQEAAWIFDSANSPETPASRMAGRIHRAALAATDGRPSPAPS